MIQHIQNKIASLKNEINSMEYTRRINEIEFPEHYDTRKLELTSKILVLNEVIMSYKPKK
jgi:hypothetical protein